MPLKPDNKHLHQLVYIFLKTRLKYNKNLTNNISSLLINFVNLVIIYISSLNYKHSFIQIFMILVFSLTYIYFYIRILKKFQKNYKLKKC